MIIAPCVSDWQPGPDEEERAPTGELQSQGHSNFTQQLVTTLERG